MGQKSKVSFKQSEIKNVLAIESSCDDTSIAIVSTEGFVLSMKSQNQDLIHGPYGGVIPELACRNHTMRILPLIEEVLKQAGWERSQIDAVAVTSRPGLLGSLLVGVTVAKTLSLLYGWPLIGVNHLEGHLYAPFLKDSEFDLKTDFEEPFVGLCVSGGHTSLVHVKAFGNYQTLGRTLDDAAGEAFDKFGKVLGLGYPAGKTVDERATQGNKNAFSFPRPLLKNKNLDFSFSGLKTAGSLEVKKHRELSFALVNDFCASFQEAIIDVLIFKLDQALQKTKLKRAVITGGVSSNSRLRQRAEELGREKNYEILIPPPRYCTDNAAMIGFVGIKKLLVGKADDLNLKAEATSKNAEIV